MEDIVKEYSKDDVTVIWQPQKCIHSKICWQGLPKAFNPKQRPWITLDDVTSAEIIAQVSKCPSGALSIKDKSNTEVNITNDITNTEIVVIKNGPLKVKGSLSIKLKDGKEETQKEVYLCRCGQSDNKPFCDGTHTKCGFKDE